MQGYSACFMREFLFNSALLGAPTLAEVIRHDLVEPNLASSTTAQLIQGKELVISSLVLGLGLGHHAEGLHHGLGEASQAGLHEIERLRR